MSMGLILTVGEIKFGRLLGQLPILLLGVLFAVPAKAEISQRIDAEENEMTASKVRVFDNPRNVIKMDAGPSWIVSEVQTPRTIYKSRFGVGLGIMQYQGLFMPLKEPANYKGDHDLYGIKRIDAKIGIRFYL